MSDKPLPGFRRRIRIAPETTRVSCELEDDYHRMAVTVRHDGSTATGIDVAMPRVPWTTCPGAAERLQRTFTGVALAAFAPRGEKTENCTHLHDLAVLAAAHAHDAGPLQYDLLVSDPIDGLRRAEIRRNGACVLGWMDEPQVWPAYNRIVEPPELAGQSLDKLRDWIRTLEPERREAARLLQWGSIIANGRRLPLARHADASLMPAGRCFSFQAQRIGQARRILDIRDFSRKDVQLLARST
jgi:hypothetical protein